MQSQRTTLQRIKCITCDAPTYMWELPFEVKRINVEASVSNLRLRQHDATGETRASHVPPPLAAAGAGHAPLQLHEALPQLELRGSDSQVPQLDRVPAAL